MKERRNVATFAGVPGREASTNIDITVRIRKARVENLKVLDKGNSDHKLIEFAGGGLGNRDVVLVEKKNAACLAEKQIGSFLKKS